MNTVLHQRTLTADDFYKAKVLFTRICFGAFIHEDQDTLVYVFRLSSLPIIQWEMYAKPNGEYRLCLIEEILP